eukprot:13798698-Alexandrium_andersonii.AAC.1
MYARTRAVTLAHAGARTHARTQARTHALSTVYVRRTLAWALLLIVLRVHAHRSLFADRRVRLETKRSALAPPVPHALQVCAAISARHLTAPV